jgi:hypothetical protein
MDDRELSALLSEVDPKGRDILRGLMRAEQFERDDFAATLMRQGIETASDLAELLDQASLSPDVRRQVARVLGQLEAT